VHPANKREVVSERVPRRGEGCQYGEKDLKGFFH